MNDTSRAVIIFISGIAVGFGLGYVSFKSYFETKADEEIASCKEMYKRREEEYNQAVIDNSVDNPDVKPDNGLTNSTSTLDVDPPETEIVDYTKYYKEKEDDVIKKTNEELNRDVVKAEDCEHVDPSELESPRDDEDAIEQEDYEMYLINEEHRKAVAENRPPYEIPEDAFGTIPAYETMDIYYYQVDDVLCDDNHEELDMPELFVGDLMETDFKFNDVPTIFLRSDVLMNDIQVHKNSVDSFYNN